MFKKRLNELRKSMQDKKIDAVLIVSDENRNYLTGFTGDESYAVISFDKAFFITDSRYVQQAKNQVKDYEIQEYSKSGTFADFLANLVEKLNVKNIGFEENILSYKTYMDYKQKLSCEMVPLNGMVEELRQIKDEYELNCIKKAAEITDNAFEHMLGYIKPGMTESSIAIELEFFMRKNGAKALSFTSIIASGVRSCLPHGVATEKKVASGEFLTMDFGCIYDDYCSDMTRTIVIGKPNDEMIKIYNIVFEAQKKALAEYKEGAAADYIDSVAREHIANCGYGKYFGHSLGHGVGRAIHEQPIVGYRNKALLKAGMVVTDEPGIYIPDFGGVRIEDLIYITKNGCEVLSKSPKNLICI